MRSDNLYALPEDLPAPVDDGAADHLAGRRLPSLALPATDGSEIDLATIAERAVVFAYPRTGRPDQEPLVPDWNLIPGARGCTPQTCAFRDLATEFADAGCRIFGLSTQETDYQREMVERLHVPFPVLSDAALKLTRALRLPTVEIGGLMLLRRLTWVAREGVIEKVFYPVFPPDRNAADVLKWLGRSA
jgi:peroxiredoxin